MNKYAKQLFDLAYELSGGEPTDVDTTVDTQVIQRTASNLERRVRRCEELILMQTELNQKIVELLKTD
jgi:hypothetical protein